MTYKLEKNINKYQLIIDAGIKCVKKEDIEGAKNFFLKAIDYKKEKHEAYINLANIYIIENEISSAIKILSEYLEIYKFKKEVANYLGDICYNYNFQKEIKKLFSITKLNEYRIHKDKQHLFFLEGSFHEKNLNFKKAIKSFKHSIKCDNKYINSYSKLLNLFESTNDLINYEIFLEKAFKDTGQQYKKILYYFKSIFFNRQKKFKESQDIILSENLVKYLNYDKEKLIKILDLESKNYENLSNYKSSFIKITERNKIISNLQKNKNFNKKVLNDLIIKYRNFYTKKNINLINNNDKFDEDKRIAFLVGFPRSGTTLLDTILRTHSRITVLEEKPYLLNERHKFFIKNNNDLEALKKISNKEKLELRKEYFKNIGFYKSKDFFIDKFPLSIIEIGFIKCFFPDAKIILALRHPCDVAISCFFSLFKINDAMVNFLTLKDTIEFYNNVFELLDFYESELNITYHQIKYESVISDFTNNIENLLKYIGLKYEKNLINFNITAKKRLKISTPSYTQVIKPLYSTSIGRWKNFKNIIDTESKLNKWIKKFKY